MTLSMLERNERGSVLVISLVILLVLTLIGIGGMSTTIMQEKMVGNARERETAFQAAEAALRDAEEEIRTSIDLTTPFRPNCAGGYCEPATTGPDVWEDATLVDWESESWDSASNVIDYGSKTPPGDVDLEGVGKQPGYILERLPVVAVGESLVSSAPPSSGNQWYRITAEGYGRNANAKAMVQSVYRK